MATAHVVRSGGIAVIEDNGQIFILEHDWEGPRDGKGVHLGMYLQPAMNNVEQLDAGAYPYAELHALLKKSWKEFHALDLCLYAMDATFSPELRTEMAELAWNVLAEADIRATIERIFTEKPLPISEVDIEGVPHDDLRAFLTRFKGE